MTRSLLAVASALLISAPALAQSAAPSEPLPAVGAAAPAEPPAKLPAPENKWRVEVSEGANSDGEIVFRVTPKGGAPSDVTVAVKNGTSENNVADNIRDAFRKSPLKDSISAESDDGEDVLLKKRMGKPAFSLQLVSNTVKGVRLNLDRE
jgi:hypothetical protein